MKISDATYKIGYGLEVTIPASSFTVRTNGFVDGAETKTIRVGSARFMEMENIAIGPDIKQLAEECILDGHSLVYVAIDSQLAGADAAIDLRIEPGLALYRRVCHAKLVRKTI